MDELISVGLQEELISDISAELESEPTFNESILRSKVINAIRDVKRARRYPSSYTDEKIQSDLYNYYSNIRSIAVYDYNMIGAEGEQSHSENSISRSYIDRNKLFSGIVSIAVF